MNKKIVELSHFVKGDYSINGLQKVFISYYPDDFQEMKRIAADILDLCKCCIFYHTSTQNIEEIDLEDFKIKLNEMNLMIVIISTRYLSNSSLAKEFEYQFAIEHHIPILPIAIEPNLEEFFTVEMNQTGLNFGEIQLLNKISLDETEISYQDKLARDLSNFLLDQKEIELIKGAFSGEIFLSYRKKDRKYAIELMNTIHSISPLRNVSIWYDEFISTGDHWSEKIANHLVQSNYFLLMVSPFITEANNYVITKEYPLAIFHKKPIIAATKQVRIGEDLDKKILHELFPEITHYIDGNSSEELEQAFSSIENNQVNSTENDYLIGLAYYNGIYMEKNVEKGFSLILSAGNRNYPLAVEKIANMYWIGDGVQINYEVSIQWLKRLVEIYYNQMYESQLVKDTMHYIKASEKLIEHLFDMSQFKESLYYGQKHIAFLERLQKEFDHSIKDYHLFITYHLCSKAAQRLSYYEKALDYGNKACIIMEKEYNIHLSKSRYHDLSVVYGRLGEVYYSMGRFDQAKEFYIKAYKIADELDQERQTLDSAQALSASLQDLVDVYNRLNEYSLANNIAKEAYKITTKMRNASNSIYVKNCYGEALISLANVLMIEHNYKEAKTILQEAKALYDEIYNKTGAISFQHSYSLVLNRLAQLYEVESNYHKALTLYQESLSVRKKALDKIHTDEKKYEVALIQFYIGNTYKKMYDSENAKDAYDETLLYLLPILCNDLKGDWHHIYADASLERFKLNTYTGKKYLQDAIEAFHWLCEHVPDNPTHQTQYQKAMRMYKICYSNQ